MPPEDNDDKDKNLSISDKRSIRSYKKQIKNHKKKIEEFKNNPTVRPGMEKLPKEVIKAQQESRIRHLEREIKAFQKNIDDIYKKY